MPPLKPPTPSEELLSIAHLLHLTHHRNKNQHRLAKWYKEFSQLRRQIGKLISEMQSFETTLSFSSSSASSVQGRGQDMGEGKGKEESKYVKVAREKVKARVEFLESRIVPGCYVAFSNVISDNQYAVLGLMLMGALAKTQGVVREWRTEFGGSQDERLEHGVREGDGEEVEEEESKSGIDLGEVVKREEIVKVVAMATDEGGDEAVEAKKGKKKRRESVREEEGGKEIESESTPAKRSKKKRRKKGGDAFDDLFAGLI